MGSKLSISMVPPILWGENLRNSIGKYYWDKIREIKFEKFPHCEFCGVMPNGKDRQAHEEWDYFPEKRIVNFRDIRTICRICHLAEHPGLVNTLINQGILQNDIDIRIKEHFCKVNECSGSEYDQELLEAKTNFDSMLSVPFWQINFNKADSNSDRNTYGYCLVNPTA